MSLNILFESSLGFGLFELIKADEIGLQVAQVQDSIKSLEKFSKIVKLKGMLIHEKWISQITNYEKQHDDVS